MSAHKRILVGLDFSNMDTQVLSYTKSLNLMLRPEKIFFVNIHQEIAIPEEITNKFPDIRESFDKKFIQEMVEETNGFNMFGADHEYLALEGNPLVKILELVDKENIDLVIVGKKSDRDHKGLAHRKLVRKAHCDVLVVTPDKKPGFNKIVVASDFSKYNKMALQKAIDIAASAKAEVICHHEYEVPTGYYKTGKSYTEFADIMRDNAIKAYSEFIKDVDTNGVKVEANFSLSNHDEIATNAFRAAQENGADLVVLGAKGRNELTALLIGSVAEAFLEEDHPIPLLIAKHKHAEFSFWDAIKHL